MSRNLDGTRFRSVLESFGWRPVISASQFKHPDHGAHHIVVYPGSAIHYELDYPWGSYGRSKYLHEPSELENHLIRFHGLSKGSETQLENQNREANGA
jgi:hypothetical protein